MNRNEFLKQLEYLLRNIPENEKQDALTYYNAYFDEAGVENEAKVITELGSPEMVAQTILADFEGQTETQGYGVYGKDSDNSNNRVFDPYEKSYGKSQNKSQDFDKKGFGISQERALDSYGNQNKSKKENKNTKIWLIVIAVLTFPLWIGIVAGLFGAVVGLLGGIFGIVVGFAGAGIGMVFSSLALIVSGILCKSLAEALAIVGVGLLCLALGLLMTVLMAWVFVKWLPKLARVVLDWGRGVLQRRKGGSEA